LELGSCVNGGGEEEEEVGWQSKRERVGGCHGQERGEIRWSAQKTKMPSLYYFVFVPY